MEKGWNSSVSNVTMKLTRALGESGRRSAPVSVIGKEVLDNYSEIVQEYVDDMIAVLGPQIAPAVKVQLKKALFKSALSKHSQLLENMKGYYSSGGDLADMYDSTESFSVVEQTPNFTLFKTLHEPQLRVLTENLDVMGKRFDPLAGQRMLPSAPCTLR